MFEIIVLTAMLGMGMGALVKGKINLSTSRVVDGVWARLIGVILLVPLPLYFAIPFAFGVGRGQQMAERRQELVIIAMALVAVAVVFAAFIALLTAKPISQSAATLPADGEADVAK
jgi:hypothetical protein